MKPRVGDVWTDRGRWAPFTIDRIDLAGNVFGTFHGFEGRHGITTRLEYMDRHRPVRVVGLLRRIWLAVGFEVRAHAA